MSATAADSQSGRGRHAVRNCAIAGQAIDDGTEAAQIQRSGCDVDSSGAGHRRAGLKLKDVPGRTTEQLRAWSKAGVHRGKSDQAATAAAIDGQSAEGIAENDGDQII